MLFDRKYVSVSLDRPTHIKASKSSLKRSSQRPLAVRTPRIATFKPIKKNQSLSSLSDLKSKPKKPLWPSQRVLSSKLKPVSMASRDQLAGDVTHFFDKINVAVIKACCDIKVGDTLRFKGANTDCVHKVRSMQIDHKNVLTVPKH